MDKVKKIYYKFKISGRPWRKFLIICLGVIWVLITILQLAYPNDRLVFYSKIDGISLGGWKKVDAISQLDGEYNGQAIPIYLGPMGKKFSSPKPIDIGLIISNQARVDSISYPWYLRIVPTSIFWAHYLTDKVADPEFSRDQGILSSYISANMSGACNIEPKDATLLASGPSLEVVESYYGASCEIGAVYDALSTITPELGGSYKAIVPVDEIAPAVSDATAQNLADSLMQKVGVGFPLTVIGSEQVISSSEVLSWLDFRSDDTSLAYSVNTDRASVFLNDNIAPLINIDPGITTINTYNFIEKSRDVGVTGKVFDVQDTIGDIKGYLDGTNKKASAVFASTPPSIVYSRSYSPADAELSALIAQFDSDHSGVYGVSMVELSDKNRLASYNDTNVFITASTYKLYVAYSTLKRVESGTWSWSDNIVNGHNLSTCFYDMIAYSNNTCAEAILDKVGLINVTNDAHEIGCINTTFLESGGIKTTPSDLMLFLGQLQMGQILNLQSSRDRLIGAMKSNVYRLGIPSGLGEFVVADKVGFLDELLHDAAIVYCPTGTYVLVIMTEGASWSSIASLASQIEALRAE